MLDARVSRCTSNSGEIPANGQIFGEKRGRGSWFRGRSHNDDKLAWYTILKHPPIHQSHQVTRWIDLAIELEGNIVGLQREVYCLPTRLHPVGQFPNLRV